MAKEIQLTQGKVAIVSDEDYEWLMQRKWSVMSRGYANNSMIGLMHRAIMTHSGVDLTGKVVDHINRDCLDNRRENLRVVTQKENIRNQPGRSSTLFRGVTWHSVTKQWQAVVIVPDGGKKNCGLYASPVIAAVFANDALRNRDGEFAVLNEIPPHIELLARQIPPRPKYSREPKLVLAQLEHAERVERAYSEWLIMKRITDWLAEAPPTASANAAANAA